jgi:nucleoside-diphosphate-sugar epimerase
MRVFITGATGFVGRALVKQLLAKHQVTALLLPHEDDLEGCGCVRGDITNAESLRGLIKDQDAVVHLAGAVGYGKSWDLCRRVNVDGTRNVASEAVRAGARRFIHLSSVCVYGRIANQPLPENAPLTKIGDPYGDTKIDAERLLRDFDLDLTILRPTVIYGPGDVMFLPKLVENLRSGRAKVIGSGKNTVDLVHVADVAAFIDNCLGNPDTINQAFNVTQPNDLRWREMVDLVADAIAVPRIKGRLPYPAALAVAGLMETAARLTGKPPRLTRYAVRVIGRQYDYRTEQAVAAGFRAHVPLRDGLRQAARAQPH